MSIKPMRAPEIATRAAELVGGDRDRQHGQKEDNFKRIAKLWQAYLEIRRDPGAPLDALDVGHMMVLMKTARTQSGAVNPDDYVDAAGYAACAGEIATHRAQPRNAQPEDSEYDPFFEYTVARFWKALYGDVIGGGAPASDAASQMRPRNPNSDM